MKTRSVLVRFPGYPFEPQALAPSRLLASVAGSLLDQGHETRILDYGTVETVLRLVEGRPSALASKIASIVAADQLGNPLQTLQLLWQMNSANRQFRERRAAFAREIAAHLATRPGLHFAAFMVNTVDDIASTLEIVKPLRAQRPKLKIIAFGTMADYFGAALARESNVFDCICVAETEAALVALAERIETPHLWCTIPNIAYCDGAQVRETSRDDMTSVSALPAPVYDPDAYPALKAEQKLRLFEIDDCRPASAEQCSRPDGETAAPRMRTVGAVCNEMWRVGTLFGARAFHFTGEIAPASHVSAIANEMLRRGISAVYTRSCNPAHAVPATFPSLFTSGCIALSFSIQTGSQRLLDRFYETGTTVTELERILKCSKQVGIFTIARFTFPCPEDDIHTRAETIRIIERTQPDAAPLSTPHVMPGSRWYNDAGRYGFGVDRAHYYERAVAAARKYPAAGQHWTNRPYRTGRWSEQEVAAQYRGLAKDIEQRGVPAMLSDEMMRMARIVADAGREAEFANRMQQDFIRGDAMGVATMVDTFNEVACVSAKRMALRAPDADRLAVGN